MREAAAPAVVAVRSIAQSAWRVVMAFKSPSSFTVRFAEQGKARVNRRNRAPLLAERIGAMQAGE